jgi:hypothetical protein
LEEFEMWDMRFLIVEGIEHREVISNFEFEFYLGHYALRLSSICNLKYLYRYCR